MSLGRIALGTGALALSLVATPVTSTAFRDVDAASLPAAHPALDAVLDAMVAAWNEDDLAGHVAPYADDATYTTASGLVQGRAAVMETLSGFQGPEGLFGTLRFEEVSTRELGDHFALVTGRFVLSAEGRPDASGRFTLVFREQNGTWQVIHDHSN